MIATPNNLRQRFESLHVWVRDGMRAPHKPLLALWAISRCLRGQPRMSPFELVDRELAKLLQRFGPNRGHMPDTQDPFWRMRQDNLWEIDRPHLMPRRPGNKAYRKDLFKLNIHGGLWEADYNALRRDPGRAWRIAKALLEAHFPATRHDDILRAIKMHSAAPSFQAMPGELDGMDLSVSGSRALDFRQTVLEAYGRQCAVCEFAVADMGTRFALDAAHIKWPQASGPDEIRNGLALCALHHKLFDEGVFTLLPEDLRVAVAKGLSGRGFDEWLGRFDGRRMRVTPGTDRNWPTTEFLSWHGREVFRSPEIVG